MTNRTIWYSNAKGQKTTQEIHKNNYIQISLRADFSKFSGRTASSIYLTPEKVQWVESLWEQLYVALEEKHGLKNTVGEPLLWDCGIDIKTYSKFLGRAELFLPGGKLNSEIERAILETISNIMNEIN